MNVARALFDVRLITKLPGVRWYSSGSNILDLSATLTVG